MTLAIWSIQNNKKTHPFYFSLTFSETRFVPRQFLLGPCSFMCGQRGRTGSKRDAEQVRDMDLSSFIPDWIHPLTWILCGLWWDVCLFFPLIWCKEKCCKATIQITLGGKSIKENTAWGNSGIRIAVSSFDSQRVLLSAEQYLNIGSFHCISEYFLILWQWSSTPWSLQTLKQLILYLGIFR